MYGNLWGYFENITFQVKTAAATFVSPSGHTDHNICDDTMTCKNTACFGWKGKSCETSCTAQCDQICQYFAALAIVLRIS